MSSILLSGSGRGDAASLSAPHPRRYTAARRRKEPGAAALRAGEPARPIAHRQISAVLLGLFAGVQVDAVQTIRAPDAQQQMCPGRAAEGCRTRFAFPALPLHVRGMSDLTPDDKAALAELLS